MSGPLGGIFFDSHCRYWKLVVPFTKVIGGHMGRF